MASYKQANERMGQTGGGMDGPELITYQEWVTKNVCKYYFELDEVLKDRPNVSPWFTNEPVLDSVTIYSDEDDNNTSLEMSIKDNTIESVFEDTNDIDKNNDIEESDDFPLEYDCMSSVNSNNIDKSNPNPIVLSNSSEDFNSFTIDTGEATSSSSDDYSSRPLLLSAKKRKVRTPPKNTKMSPIEAKGIQRKLVKKKKSIARRNGSKISSNMLGMDNEDRQLLKETAFAKINQENQRYLRLEKLESEKLRIENERLEMDKTAMVMKSEQVSVQTCLEKSRVVLLKLEIFKAREEIKKQLPHVTEEYLNTHFPYPE